MCLLPLRHQALLEATGRRAIGSHQRARGRYKAVPTAELIQPVSAEASEADTAEMVTMVAIAI